MRLEPLPETREALASLSQNADQDLTGDLIRQGQVVEALVPNLVGMSVAQVNEGLTFTLTASDTRVAVLDAIQYAFGGPCVDAALADSVVLGGTTEGGLLDERRWAAFARVSAAHGVMSTLSLPIHADRQVVGSVNLYAATPNAFAGKEQQVALALGAWAAGAVHNADLSFSTRAAARQAPRLLADRAVIDRAVGIVCSAEGVSQQVAREIISDAARRAGQDELSVARALIRPFAEEDRDAS